MHSHVARVVCARGELVEEEGIGGEMAVAAGFVVVEGKIGFVVVFENGTDGMGGWCPTGSGRATMADSLS